MRDWGGVYGRLGVGYGRLLYGIWEIREYDMGD